MGHKAHPVGLRLGIHRKWKSNWFFNSKNYPKFMFLNLNLEKFFKGFLFFHYSKSLLLNTQIIKLASNQLFIFITYYRIRKRREYFKKSKKNWWIRRLKFKNWRTGLEKYFEKKNLISLYKNYYKMQGSSFFFQNILKNLSGNLKKNIYLLNFSKLILNKNKIKYLKYLKLILNTLNTYKNVLNYKFHLKKYIFQKIIKIKKKNFNFNKQKYNIYWIIYIISKTIINSNILKKKILILINKNIFKNFCKKFLKRNVLGFYKENTSILLQYKKCLKWTKKKKSISFKTLPQIKKFLSKITNLKINIIFINALSFAKFFYFIIKTDKKKKKKIRQKFDIFRLQRYMTTRFKYDAIFIKDFVYLAFIGVLLKNPECIVNFISEQFKRLPKNRKQFKLLKFINHTLQVLCKKRDEIFGMKLQIKGRLNRRNRTRRWVFKNGNLAIQTYTTRVEYGYSEGLIRSGLIGIKLWIFYQKKFTQIFKEKLLEYLFYSKYTEILKEKIKKKFLKKTTKSYNNINKNLFSFNIKNVKAQSKKISKK